VNDDYIIINNTGGGGSWTDVWGNDGGLSYNGTWDGWTGSWNYTGDLGTPATVSYTFTGTGIRVFTYTWNTEYNGHEVRVDGDLKQTYTDIGTGDGPVQTYELTGMTNEEHTIEITNINSGNSQYHLNKFQYYGGGSAISGTFNGLAEGDTITSGGYDFEVSYVGGTGNDVVLTMVAASSSTKTKADNTNALNTDASWVGGTKPVATDTAKWDNTVTIARTANIGGNITWEKLIYTDPGGKGTIGATGGSALTLGSGGIDMSSATQDLDIAAALTMGASQTWNVASGKVLTASGVVSGAYSLTTSGSGSVVLSNAANTYTGITTISGDTLSVGTLANGGSNSGIGASSNAAANLVFDGGTLKYPGGNVTTDRLLHVCH
jgi:fibronectin-binding autotransporter adhesin